MIKLALVYTFAWLIAIVSTSACSSVEHAYDCNRICDRYQECFDNNYDSSSCQSKCRNHASDDKTYAEHAENCQDCIEDRSCAGATFSCATECSDIVP
jgi:hypothetical protein